MADEKDDVSIADNEPVSSRFTDVGEDAFSLFGLQDATPDRERSENIRQQLDEIYAQLEESNDSG